MDASYDMRKILPLLTDLRGYMTPQQVDMAKKFEADIETVKRDEKQQSDWDFAQDINGY